MAHLSLLAAPFASNNDAARVHGPVGLTRSSRTFPMRPVDDVPPPLASLPKLVEMILRNLLTAVQAVHSILVVARPELAKARIELVGPTHKVIGWLAVAAVERCRVQLRDVVTDRELVFPAPVSGPGANAPGDDLVLRPVDDAPSPLSPLPGLTEIVLRHLLGAVQAVHSILAVARPELRRVRIELIDPTDKVVGWLAVAGLGCMDRCRVELRDVVTGKELVFPALVSGPGTNPPSDNPMLRSDPKIPAPTATQRAEIVELVGRLALTDGELAVVLRGCKVQGGVEAIPDYFTAQRVLGDLEAMRRIRSKDGRVDPLYHQAVECVLACARGSVSEVERRLGIGYGKASRFIEAMCADGIVGPHCGARPRKVLIGEVKDRRVEELYDAAVKVALAYGSGSVSELQRRLRIGNAVARRLIERMEVEAIVGARRGRQPRKLLIGGKDGQDDLYDAAVKVVLESGRGSVNEIQRRLNVGRRRSHRLIENMTTAGILGEHCDGRPRRVLIGIEETGPRGSEQECKGGRATADGDAPRQARPAQGTAYRSRRTRPGARRGRKRAHGRAA